MRHLSLQQLSACVDDSLSGVSLEIVERHLSGCDECRARQLRLQRVDALLSQMIRLEPSDAWLEKVAAEIAVRLRDETHGTTGGSGWTTPPPDRTTPAPLPQAVFEPGREVSMPRPLSIARIPDSAFPVEAPLPAASSASGAPSPVPQATGSASAPPPASPHRPARVPAAETPRWSVHSERITRARRDAADKPRATVPPMISGLAGGVFAGALVVTLVFGLRARTHPQRSVSPASSSGSSAALSRTPVAPEVAPERMSVTAPPAADPADPHATSRRPFVAPEGAALPMKSAAVSPPPTVAAASPSAASPAPSSARDDEEEADWPMLCGIILDETGAPVSGARVLLADFDLGARTDRRGRFCLSGPAGDRTMSVIALGFATHRQLVTLTQATADLSVVLKNVR